LEPVKWRRVDDREMEERRCEVAADPHGDENQDACEERGPAERGNESVGESIAPRRTPRVLGF